MLGLIFSQKAFDYCKDLQEKGLEGVQKRRIY